MLVSLWRTCLGVCLSVLVVGLCASTPCAAEGQLGCEAGKGTYNPPILPDFTRPPDDRDFQKDRDYISMDAVCWYVNAKSNSFDDKIVSGTLRVSMGSESYGAVLGEYKLKAGAKMAPLFNEPLICTRVYRGERPQVVLLLSGVKKSTAVGALLRELGTASLGIARGAIQAASPAGPSKLLMNAGQQLLSGAEQLLTGSGTLELVNPTGIKCTLDESHMKGPTNFILLHRGTDLATHTVSIRELAGQAPTVLCDGQPLTDGAWVLVKVRRECRFAGPRPWEDLTRLAVARLDNLMQDWLLQPTQEKRADVLTRVVPSPGDDTLNEADLMMAARTQIETDAALTDMQRVYEKLKLVAFLLLARRQATAVDGDPAAYVKGKALLEGELAAGQLPSDPAIRILFETVATKELAPTKSGAESWAPSPEALKKQIWDTFRVIGMQERAEKLQP